MAAGTVQPPPFTTPLLEAGGRLSPLWSRFFLQTQQQLDVGAAPSNARYFVGSSNGQLTAETNLAALASGYLKLSVALGVATPSTTATVPSSDLSGALPAISGAALTALSSSALTGALPALSGAALTGLTGPQITHTVTTITFADTPYAVSASDETILVNATGGNVAVTLSTATVGRVVTVKKTDASANTVQLTGTVDGSVNPTIGTQYQARTVVWTGSAFSVIASV